MDVLEHDFTQRIREYCLRNAVPIVSGRIDQAKRRNAFFNHLEMVIGVSFLLGEISLRCNDQSKVARAGRVEPWRINLVNRSMTDGKPNSTIRTQCGTHATLGAGGPA